MMGTVRPPATDDEARLAAQFRTRLASSPAFYPIASIQETTASGSSGSRRTTTPLQASRLAYASCKRPACGVPDRCVAREGLPERCRFIFHISHVGSTLLSRLLGHHPAPFSLREPATLRHLAEVTLAKSIRQPVDSKGIQRTVIGVRASLVADVRARSCCVIKATSFVSEMSQLLMERVSGSRSILCLSHHSLPQSPLDGR